MTGPDDNSKNISLSNTFDNWHTYEIQWTPDEITWLVDGQKGRTKKRSETWNATANQWNYPQTPARVQLSLWPGGAETNPKGTVDWAGGRIDWNNHEDIKKHGFYYAMVESVEVSCMNAPKGSSYWYADARGTNDTVRDTDKRTTLKSLAGSGIDLDAGGSDASSSSSSSKPAQTGAAAPPPQVPGGSNVGPANGGGGGSGGSGGSGGAPPPPAEDCTSKTFVQSCGQKSNNARRAMSPSSSSLGASALAVVIAFAAVVTL